MHMADALLSPTVGVTLWAASGATLGWCARRIREARDERALPLMGVLGAFVFAAQMINFAIPATGSSGHLGGGLLLSILLGPHAAFMVIASVLAVQAIFFADGGLLALGANLFNLGVLPCFVAYPLVYRMVVPERLAPPSRGRLALACLAAAIVALQMGALGVVLETTASRISSLPMGSFLLLMLPIHLAIGVAEGLATAALVLFIRRHRPDLLARQAGPGARLRPALAGFALAALLTGGVLSGFASQRPDGLEWSVERTAQQPAPPAPESALHRALAEAQRRLALMPDYAFASSPASGAAASPDPVPASSIAGIAGGLVTFCLIALAAAALRRR
ncbi:MAG: energy-coupling factor ABC transporter permease [Rhodocyclaceae bacterium]